MGSRPIKIVTGFRRSGKSFLVQQVAYYSIDPGLISLYRPPEENLALRLEHVVFLELLRRGATVYYGTNDSGRELDFLASAGGRSFDRYQVAVSLTADDERRELGAFDLADPYLQAGQNFFLSLDEAGEIRHWQGVEIGRHHLIKWLLALPQAKIVNLAKAPKHIRSHGAVSCGA